MWVIGGRPLGYIGYPYFYNDVWYSENGTDWVEATDDAPFYVRYKHTSFVYKNKIWVMGGAMEANTHRNDVWYSSNGTSWTEATPEAEWEKRIVTVEEHQKIGGLGSAVSEFLSENFPVKIKMVGIDDKFGQSGKPEELIEHYGLGVEGIKSAVKEVLG